MELHAILGGPPVTSALVALGAAIVTLWTIWSCLRMLIAPGEHDPSHPKYRVLRRDR